MKIFSHFVSSDLVNQYLLINEGTNEAVMIDAPELDSKIIDIIESEKLDLKAILVTHTHESHIASLGTVYKIYSPRLYSYFESVGSYPSIKVKDGTIIKEAGFSIECFHVPGHSLDSICYKAGDALFTGDTLECGFISQTKALVEKELLIESIKEKLFNLDGNTLIFPGHGPLSKIRIEKMFNQDILEANITIFS